MAHPATTVRRASTGTCHQDARARVGLRLRGQPGPGRRNDNDRMSGSFENLNLQAPFVVEDGQSRSLHFTHGELQSSMRLDRPDELAVDYTRTMMGFLLLHPSARQVAMIGLGGGSLAKFCHRHLPAARMTVVDNNPGVIALRREFGIPDDDARLSVRADDGAVFVRTTSRIDVLLVDGFDQTGQPPALCSQAFYDDCFQALAPGGVLVVNLHFDHPEFDLFIERIAHSFKGNAMQVLSPEKGNCIVFAARRRPVTLQALRNPGWTAGLDAQAQRQLRNEFAQIGWTACPLDAVGR
jgi:spermidine synthase